MRTMTEKNEIVRTAAEAAAAVVACVGTLAALLLPVLGTLY